MRQVGKLRRIREPDDAGPEVRQEIWGRGNARLKPHVMDVDEGRQYFGLQWTFFASKDLDLLPTRYIQKQRTVFSLKHIEIAFSSLGHRFLGTI